MSSLADIFAAVRLQLDGSGFEAQATALANKSGKSAGATMSASLGSQMKKGLAEGLGIGVGLGAVNLVASAVGRTVGFVEDLVQAGIKEEASISRLNASLKANVAGWDGSTVAIEKTLKARIDLGFSDEEQRTSLALLVAATHDVSKALDIQRVAMDLARFKGISLAEASNALTKVEAGSYRILKSLGIQLKANATQQDALNAVEAVAKGQAEEYAQTVEGKLLVAQTKFGEEMDRLGVAILPIVTGALDVATPALDRFAAGLDKAGDSGSGLIDRLAGLGQALGELNPSAWATNYTLEELRKKQTEADAATAKWAADIKGFSHDSTDMASDASHIGEAAESMTATVKTAAREHQQALEDIRYKSGTLRVNVLSDNWKMSQSYKSLTDFLLGAFNTDFSRATDIMDARTALSADRTEAADLRKQLASGTLTAKEAADARQRILDLEVEDARQYAILAERQALNTGDYAVWAATLQRLADGTKGAVHDAYLKALADIAALRSAAATDINVSVNYRTTTSGTRQGGIGGKAAGGPVYAGVPYVVGERRAEVFVPDVNGRIIDHVPAGFGAAAAPMIGSLTVQVTAGADTSLQTAKRFGQAVLDEVAAGFREQSARFARGAA